MKTFYALASCLVFVLAVRISPVVAQTTLTTTTTFLNNNGTGAVSFNIANNNTSGVILTDVAGLTGTAGTDAVEIYYNATPINGPLSTLIPANGWIQIAAGTITGIANTTSTATQPFFTGLNFLIPANTTYGFVVYCTGQRYYTLPAAATISSGGIDMINTPTTAYGNGIPPAAPSIASRGWIGTLTFMPALPCVSPPTPGTSTTSAANVCTGGSFQLGLTGNSLGSGQTYQWQSATSASGPWTNLGPSQNTPTYTTTATTTLYYRNAVTCGASTTYSTPVLVTVPALFPGGTYTINFALPTAGSNFQTFSAAAAAISCGITSSVIFNVSPGTYNEQVSIPSINTNATRTVTFNGNNANLTYTNTTNSSNYAVFRLDGTDWVRINKLNITAVATGTYGLGVLMTNNADNNIVDSCTINVGNNITSTSFVAMCIGGSATSATTASATSATTTCDSNIVSNTTLIGGYYNTILYGSSVAPQQYNQLINNVVKDQYFYGIYMAYNNNAQIIGNDISRPTRTTLSTFYGIYQTTGNLKGNISKNRIHNPFGADPVNTGAAYGIYHGATATVGNENVMSNNIFYNMDGNGAHYVMYTAGAYCRWYFNTVSEDYTAATAGLTYVCYVISTYAGVEYRNNNISLTRGGATAKYCVYHSSTAYPAIHNNNNYYVNPTNTANFVGYYGGTNCATLAAWQTASAKDAASFAVIPNFVAPTLGDLTPTNNAMDNIGLPIAGITTDILGTIRNAVNPDAGAFEFNNFCAPPSGLTASSVTASSAVLSWSAVTGLGYEYVLDQNAGNPPGAGTFIATNNYAANALTGSTTYYFHVRNKCGPTNFSTWITISFTTCPSAVITPLSSIIFCAGGSVILTASPGTSYQWKLAGNNIAGATTSSYTATGAGSYTVTITSANGCVITSAPVNVQVGTPPATITPSGASSICPGATAVLAAQSGVGLTYQWMLNGANIPGATSSTYNATAAGNYTVFVSSGPNCNATTATPTTISLFPVTPAAIAPPLYPAVCPGNSITLFANTGNGLTYQWLLNGTNIAGATASTYTGSTAGNYTVKVTSTVTGCTNTSAIQNIAAAVAPPASINAPGQVTACDSAVLTANPGAGFTYQWILNGADIPGATGQSFSAPLSGNYAVRVTNSGGCYTLSNAIAVVVNHSPVGMITYNSPLVFCEGSAVLLNVVPEPGLLIQWMKDGLAIPGASGIQYAATSTGTYTVLVTNNNGCSKMSQPVAVVVYPSPFPAISTNGSVLSTGNYIFYQWFFNTTAIPGANYQTYTPSANGAYSVMVTDGNGCSGVSDIFFLNSLGVGNNPAASGGIRIFPNPASADVTIENTAHLPMTQVSILNGLGAIVYDAPVSGSQVTVHTTALPAGIYTVRIRTEGGMVFRKLELLK